MISLRYYRELSLLLLGILLVLLSQACAAPANDIHAVRLQSEVGWQCWAIVQDGKAVGGNCVRVEI